MRQKTIWSDKYKDVSFEVVKWAGHDGKPIWNYYILIRRDTLTQAQWDALNVFVEKTPDISVFAAGLDYFCTPAMNWEWHHGCTFGERYGNNPNQPRELEGMKYGCDYNHLWDVFPPDLDTVVSDCRRTIDSFLAWRDSPCDEPKHEVSHD